MIFPLRFLVVSSNLTLQLEIVIFQKGPLQEMAYLLKHLQGSSWQPSSNRVNGWNFPQVHMLHFSSARTTIDGMFCPIPRLQNLLYLEAHEDIERRKGVAMEASPHASTLVHSEAAIPNLRNSYLSSCSTQYNPHMLLLYFVCTTLEFF